MKQTIKKRQQFAQNKIDYIVYSNPQKVGALLYNYGYQVPNDVHDLVKAIKLLIKKHGKQVISDLLKLHPDSKAILSATEPQEDHFCGACSSSYNPEDNYCGSCGHDNYTGEFSIKDYLDQLSKMSTVELKDYYGNLLNKANKQPENKQLSDQLHLTWDALLKRLKVAEKEKELKKDKPKEESYFKHLIRTDWAIAGVILFAGILIGTAVKRCPPPMIKSM